MRRNRPLGLWVLLAAVLPFTGGCMAGLENGLDLILGIWSQDAAQVAPYLAIAVPAILWGRFLNFRN